jgi:hypothetical protein
MINITTPLQITKIYLITNCYGDPNKVYVGKEKYKKYPTRKGTHKKTYGNNIIFTYIDEVNSLNHKDWKPLECFWIEYFRQLGFDIQNKNKGGGGLDLLSFESRQLISKANKGKPKPPSFGNNHSIKMKGKNVGKKLTEEHLVILSLTHKNKMLSDYTKSQIYTAERNNNVSKSLLGKSKSNEHKQNMSLSRLNKPTKKAIPITQYDLEGNFIKDWDKITDILNYFNKSKNDSSITQCCKGIIKTAFGYKWKYKQL